MARFKALVRVIQGQQGGQVQGHNKSQAMSAEHRGGGRRACTEWGSETVDSICGGRTCFGVGIIDSGSLESVSSGPRVKETSTKESERRMRVRGDEPEFGYEEGSEMGRVEGNEPTAMSEESAKSGRSLRSEQRICSQLSHSRTRYGR